MQTIELLHLSLLNFKGVHQLDIDFGLDTNIYGRNGSGKTTIFDAFLWVLFGKDSTDRKDFEIKTLDENNQPFRKRSHEVKAVLRIADEEITLKKIYREKWTKKRGSATEEFTGHETEYFYNEVPYNEREYTAKLAEIIDEKQFKLLTNLHYFNEVLKWQDRRSLLMQLAGGQSDLELATELNTERQYDHLIKALNQKKSLEEYRKELVSKKNKIKEESKALPDRIDELRRSLPEAADYAAIEKQLGVLAESLESVESMIMSKSAKEKQHQEQITSLVRQQGDIDRQIVQLEYESTRTTSDNRLKREAAIAEKRQQIRAKQDEKADLLKQYNTVDAKLSAATKSIECLNKELAEGRQAWTDESAREFSFDPTSCKCPTCQQVLPDMDVTAREIELKNNFNAERSKNLEKIKEKGEALGKELKDAEAEKQLRTAELGNIKAKGENLAIEIQQLQNEQAILEEEHTRLTSDEITNAKQSFENDPRVIELRHSRKLLQQEIDAPQNSDDKAELLQRRRDINAEIESLKIQLAKRETIEKMNDRIAELMNQDQESASTIAELEGLEFSLLEFDKQKMELVERKINGLFTLVTFKLFDQQIKGGTSPTCVTLIKGVPYTDANTASRINASLDIIRVFSEYFGTKAPVFIDNRESITSLIPTDLQIVNLFVSADYTRLHVEKAMEREVAF